MTTLQRNLKFNGIKTFESEEFGTIRTIAIQGEPWFVGKDIAGALEYKEPHKAIKRHVEEDDRMKHPIIDSLGRNQGTFFINESGMYALIFGSKLDKAKRFKHWVTSDVLPTIRKNGVYMTDEKAYALTHDPQSLSDLLIQAGEQLKRKDIIIKEMQPKALFADTVTSSESTILVGELAKLLKQNGTDIGQNRLFDRLREDGYLIKRKGTDYNMPTQRSMEMKLFEIKERTMVDSNGVTRITKTPKVTGKGQVYFVNRYCEKEAVENVGIEK